MSADFVKSLVSIFPRIARNEWEEILAQIHNSAGGLPPDNRNADYAATLLEEAAESISDPSGKAVLLRHAIYRARWFASESTSGGENLERSAHLKSLYTKLEHLAQQGIQLDGPASGGAAS